MKSLLIVPVLIFSILVGCSQAADNSHSDTVDVSSDDSLTRIKYTLFKHNETGVYYFQFVHIEPGNPKELRYVPVTNDSELIKDINEEKFGAYFNFYTDDKYVFVLSDQYDFYKATVTSIDSIEKGNYYIDSYWRLSGNKVQYYKGRGILECADDVNHVVEYIIQDTSSFVVLDIQKADCAMADGRVLVNGCFLQDTTGQNKELYAEIMRAFKEGKTKPKSSW